MSNRVEFVLYLYAESPMHAGAAESLGALDLPVQREAGTRYPVVWGQSLKGALRQAATDAVWPESQIVSVFGSSIEDSVRSDASGDDAQPADGVEVGDVEPRQTTPGSLSVGDAQLVAMPVPTLRRAFAWATSELALTRLRRKYANLPAVHQGTLPAVPSGFPDAAGLTGSPDWARTGVDVAGRAEVIGPCLVDLGGAVNAPVHDWAAKMAADVFGTDELFKPCADKLRDDLLCVGSDVMPVLLSECTEFVARVQLNSNKTVENLFYSEYLPAETILAASLTLSPTRTGRTEVPAADINALITLLDGKLLQIGGDETIGKGLTWTRLVGVTR